MSSSINIPSFVTFYNAKEYAISFESSKKILVEYAVNSQHRVTCKDWVGIFPNDCSFQYSVDFDRMVSYEFVLHRPVSQKELRYNMNISLGSAGNLNFDEEYVFVYFSSNSEPLGVSDTFRFIDPAARNGLPSAQFEHNMPYLHITENKQKVPNKHAKNNMLTKGKNYGFKQRSYLVPEEILVTKSTLGEDDENFTKNRQEQVESKSTKFYQGHLNKVHQELVQYSVNNSQFITSCKPNSNCTNCQRVGALLDTQTELYLQVKNLAEINSDLTEKITKLEKQIELGQAAYQKQSVLLMRERDSRLFYQRFTKESGLQNQFGPNSQTVLASNDSAPCQRSRPEEKVRINQMLKLKAIVGNQEEKLRTLSLKLEMEEDKVRSLTQQIEEIQCCEIEKVKAVMKDIADLSCRDNSFNNNVGEGVGNNE